jgi:hypothetical protein
MGFQGLFLNMFQNSKDDGLGHIESNIVCPIILFYFVTIDKFDPNPVLFNINKLKPNMFIEDIILQHVLANPSDLVVNEQVQIEEPLT